jgi:hypothetical protein
MLILTISLQLVVSVGEKTSWYVKKSQLGRSQSCSLVLVFVLRNRLVQRKNRTQVKKPGSESPHKQFTSYATAKLTYRLEFSLFPFPCSAGAPPPQPLTPPEVPTTQPASTPAGSSGGSFQAQDKYGVSIYSVSRPSVIVISRRSSAHLLEAGSAPELASLMPPMLEPADATEVVLP